MRDATSSTLKQVTEVAAENAICRAFNFCHKSQVTEMPARLARGVAAATAKKTHVVAPRTIAAPSAGGPRIYDPAERAFRRPRAARPHARRSGAQRAARCL